MFFEAFAFSIFYEHLYAFIASALGGFSLGIQKKHCGQVVFLAPHQKHGDESERTFVLLLRLLCSALLADGEAGFWRYIPSFLLSMNSVFIVGGIVCVYLCMSE